VVQTHTAIQLGSFKAADGKE